MKFLLTRPKELPGSRPLRALTMTVQAKVVASDPVTHMPDPGRSVKRIAAEFSGTPAAFDSLRAQSKANWTDEERLRVERHILAHEWYGRGIYLFPGQEMPAEHESFLAEFTTEAVMTRAAEAGTCVFVTKEFPVEVCGGETLPGTRYCEVHFREVEAANPTEVPAAPEEAVV